MIDPGLPSRRRFLARMGLGAAAAPLVLGVGDALVGRALGQVTRRKLAFVFVHGECAPYGSEWGYTPVGIAHDTVREDRTGVELSPLLAPLAPLREKLVVVDNLRLRASNENSIHGWKRGLLAATGKCEAPTHQTIDQYLAGTIGRTAPLKSLLFGGQGGGWADTATSTFVAGPGMDARHVGNPALLLSQLVGGAGAGTGQAAGASPAAYRGKLLDLVREDVRRLERGLAAEEKAALTGYLGAMEGFAKQEEALARAAGQCGLPTTAPTTGGNTARFTSMMQIATLALRCGVTNVVGATIGNSGIHEDMGGWSGPWGPYQGHPSTPAGAPPAYARWLRDFSKYSLGLVVELVSGLGPLAGDLVVAVIPAGGVANNPGLQHHGTGRGVAYLYDGTGRLKTGARFLRPAREEGRDMADLYTTLAHALGAPTEKFNGVGTGPIRELLA